MEDFSDSIKTGNISAVREALDRNPGLASMPLEGAPSPILLALYHGQPQIAEAIRGYQVGLSIFESAAMGDLHEISRNLALDQKRLNNFSEDGFTPLGYAAFFGHAEAVRTLLDAGADPTVASDNSLAVLPVHSAMAGEHKEMARMLLERGGGWSAASGAGWTPLHYAAHYGDIETARFLLQNGAKANIGNSDGKTPTHIATERGHTALASLLASSI